MVPSYACRVHRNLGEKRGGRGAWGRPWTRTGRYSGGTGINCGTSAWCLTRNGDHLPHHHRNGNISDELGKVEGRVCESLHSARQHRRANPGDALGHSQPLHLKIHPRRTLARSIPPAVVWRWMYITISHLHETTTSIRAPRHGSCSWTPRATFASGPETL